jgi:hypothetical protein
MKTYKIDFSKGLNVVTDKRLTPEGYIVLADNIDLRSGSLHPFKFPEPYIGISGGIPAGTTCIWEFKNNWFFSALYRTYTAEYINTQTRVYFTESILSPAGTYTTSHLPPQKIVNGIQAQLGTPVPLLPPSVTATTSYTPNSFTATESNTGGYLGTGEYSYRISAVINGQVMPPAGSVLINIPQVGGSNISTGAITLGWHPVQGAAGYAVTGYIIFGRTLGQEQTLFTLGSGATTVTDSGSSSASGAYAVNYQPLNPLTYVYTYVRDVGTMIDESGPSPISNTVNSSFVRIITRNPVADGFYSNATQYTANTYESSLFPVLNIVGLTYSGADAVLSVSTNPTNYPWWVNGMKLVFGNDPTNTPYSFTIPYALAQPTGLVTDGINSAYPTGVPAGTYHYVVCACRGAVTTFYDYPNLLPITTQASASLLVTVASASAIGLAWNGVNGATGYVIIRYNGTTYQVVGILSGNATYFQDINDYATWGYPTVSAFPTVNNTGITYNPINVTAPLSWENPSPASVGQIIIMSESVSSSFTAIPTYPGALNTIALAASKIDTFSPAFAGVDQDIINITSSPVTTMQGLAIYYNDSLGILFYPAFINVFTPPQASGTTPVTITLSDIPNNAYYKYWNIYRAGDAGTSFVFVSQQPISSLSYTDTIGVTGLGEDIPTFYPDITTGGTVSFQPPPNDGYYPQLYNGMMFMIDGNLVRWTPTGFPDAWPAIYSQSFAFPPQALLVYGGGVYVFCENGVYRLDGFLPGQINMTQLMADGCIAPYSPKVVGEHIVYLAKRGLMMIRGMDASSITERFIPYRLMTQPSSFMGGITPQNFWWFTTDHTSSYGALLDIGMNPIPAADGFGVVTAKDKPLSGLIYEARSFVWQNKYYLYFVNSPTNDFQGNPCWCVDLGILNLAFVLPNYPVTTLGFKPTDVHVSSTGECYALLTIDPTNDPANQSNFAISESEFNATFTPTVSTTSQALFRFNPTFGQNVPMRWRTSETTGGAPNTRKRWREVRLNGQGTHQIRVFIDGALQTFANGLTYTSLTLSESPLHPSRVLLPPGSWGFSCSVEGCGDGVVRVIELGFDPMAGEDNPKEGKE